jgi:hypothetical protein
MDPYLPINEIVEGGLPTLLLPGKVVAQPWMSSNDKQYIQSQPGIQYVIKFLEQFIPARRNTMPIKPAKSPGERYLAFKSGTGSGKSTTLPPFLYKTFFEGLHKNIGMTEPRVFNCIDIVDNIAKYNPTLKIGENLGYSTGNFKKKPTKGIVIETVGVLLQQLKTLTDEEFMSKYFVIIIDEVHSRSVDNDLVMYYLKKLIERQYTSPECPFVILTSGTFDEKLFMTYYDMPKEHYIEVIGSTFPIEEHWQKEPVRDVLETIKTVIKEIHTSDAGKKDIAEGKTGFDMDILIIADSTPMLDRITYEIHKLNLDSEIAKVGYIIPIPINSERFAAGGKQYQALMSNVSTLKGHLMTEQSTNIKLGGYGFTCATTVVNGGIVTTDYDSFLSEVGIKGGMMMSPTELLEHIQWRTETIKFSRRVIIATNLIETGVTPEIKYCIDTGLMISTEFNPIYNSTVLGLGAPVTKGMAIQRRGRVGRESPGVWYPIYTKEIFNNLISDQFPDIITQDITENILGAIIQETGSVLDPYDRTLSFKNKTGFAVSALDIMGYPAVDSLEYCIEKLFVLGFIDNIGIKNKNIIVPTKLGMVANKFRKIKMENVKMILAGFYYKANILDLITIAIFVEAKKWETFSKRKLKSFVPRNILGLSAFESEMHSKMFWADEFIEALWIWYDFMEALDSINPSSKKKMGVGYAKKWCDENELVYEGMLSIVQARDELIDSMINIGVNPYYNGLNLKRGTYNLKSMINRDIDLGMREIAKIKSCIYEGYKLNTATFDRNKNMYVLDWKRIPIENIESKLIKTVPVPPEQESIRQDRPQHIIVSKFIVMPGRANRNIYALGTAGPIGVLDGFVDIDDGILYQW